MSHVLQWKENYFKGNEMYLAILALLEPLLSAKVTNVGIKLATSTAILYMFRGKILL